MKLFRDIGWAIFSISIIIMLFLYINIDAKSRSHLEISELQFSGKETGLKTIKEWSEIITTHKTTLLAEARKITQWDYLFILGYTFAIYIISYTVMQRESRAVMNSLIRLNFLLVLIVGLLDLIENTITLHNMQSWNVGQKFCPTYLFSYPKFILTAWMLIILLGSCIIRPKNRTFYSMTS